MNSHCIFVAQCWTVFIYVVLCVQKDFIPWKIKTTTAENILNIYYQMNAINKGLIT